MPRKEHKYHYIYKTTCKVTNGFENKKIKKDSLVPEGWEKRKNYKRGIE